MLFQTKVKETFTSTKKKETKRISVPKDTVPIKSSQTSILSQDLPHAQVYEGQKNQLSSVVQKRKKRKTSKDVEYDSSNSDDDVHDEDDIQMEEEEEEDELQDDLVIEEDEEHDPEEVVHDDEIEDEGTDDDFTSGGDMDVRQTQECSLLNRRGLKAKIPKEFIHSNTSVAEQVSLDSDLTNSLTRNKKYLMSDDDLRRIIENQQSIIEKLRSRLDGAKKLELNPIQEGHVRKLVKFELWKRIQFVRHTHVLDGYETDGTIGKFVMDRLNIDTNCREGFWECYKHVVRKTLKQQRNVVHSALRKKFIGTFIFMNCFFFGFLI